MRTARSITSGENFGDFLMMAPFSQSKEPPQNPEMAWSAHLQRRR
jgi:hypothetical protein